MIKNNMFENSNSKIISLNFDNSETYYLNLFNVAEPKEIMEEDIVKHVETIINLRRMLYPLNMDEPKDILEIICIVNNLELSDSDKYRILGIIKVG